MAECPLPKPNTRVRFPSPAPNEKDAFGHLFLFNANVVLISATDAVYLQISLEGSV